MWLRYYHPLGQPRNGAGGRLLARGLSECARYAEMRVLSKGTVLFNPGEYDHVIYYLLSGQVRIKNPTATSNGSHFEIITSIAPGQYTHPIGGDTMPRTVHAQIISRSAFLCIDMENPRMLDSLQQLMQLTEHTERKEVDDTQWMENLLNQRWLKLVDGKFVQRLFAIAERVEVKAGEILQEYGKLVKYVYIIDKGSCLQFVGKPMSLLVTMSMAASCGGKLAPSKNIRMLSSGACLGDVQAVSLEENREAKPSPYTAQMQTSGEVLRISRAEFNKNFGHYVLEWLVNHYNWSQETPVDGRVPN